MKQTLNRTAGLLLAGTAALALAACGNNNADAPAAESTQTATVTMDQPVASANPHADKDIVTAAAATPDLSTLAQIVTAAGLGERLAGPGPFTVFAPTNAAFDKLPAETKTRAADAANARETSRLLTYHVVPGRLTAADLKSQVDATNGTATLTTIQGGRLTLRDLGNNQWELTDARGTKARITVADQMRSNGVVHVIDTVLQPAA